MAATTKQGAAVAPDARMRKRRTRAKEKTKQDRWKEIHQEERYYTGKHVASICRMWPAC
jgi:hypothetical protein